MVAPPVASGGSSSTLERSEVQNWRLGERLRADADGIVLEKNNRVNTPECGRSIARLRTITIDCRGILIDLLMAIPSVLLEK